MRGGWRKKGISLREASDKAWESTHFRLRLPRAEASPSAPQLNRSRARAARLGLACCSGSSPNPAPRVPPAPQIQPQQTLR